jgi:hypothetical protein
VSAGRDVIDQTAIGVIIMKTSAYGIVSRNQLWNENASAGCSSSERSRSAGALGQRTSQRQKTTEDDIDILDEGERTKSRFGSEVLAMRATPIRQTPIAFTLVPRIVGIDAVEWLR